MITSAHRLRWVVGLLALAAGGSCKTRLIQCADCNQPEVRQLTTSCRETETGNKVDALFMIDNSASMDAMQAELQARFPEFLQVFHDLAEQGTYVDLHIGVVTSDYGAGATGGGSHSNCAPSPGGDRGFLQAIGQLAAADCQPPRGLPFIEYTFGAGGHDTGNLPDGQSLDATFTCMASVGSHGCGMEHQLESVYAALHNQVENAGFLRDDALLTIVYLTNEDDCSAPASSDLFDENKEPQYGVDGSYRCTRFGVVCGDPPQRPPYDTSNGPLAMCVPAPNPGGAGPGKLFDVSRYVDYFTRPAFQGGVKFDPLDVLLVGIDAPEQPFEVIQAEAASGNNGQPYVECTSPGSQPFCTPTLQHSCQNSLQPAFYGNPSVRLNTVIRSSSNHSLSSICENQWSAVLANIGKLIVSQLGACCLPEALPIDARTPDNSAAWIADCTVEEVTQDLDGSAQVMAVPRCGGAQAPPCWRVNLKNECAGLSPQMLGVTIERGGAPVPPHTTARASCRGSN